MCQRFPKTELHFVFVINQVLKYLIVIGVFTSKVFVGPRSMAKLKHLTCWGLLLRVVTSGVWWFKWTVRNIGASVLNVDLVLKGIMALLLKTPLVIIFLIKPELNQFIIVHYFDTDKFFYVVSIMHWFVVGFLAGILKADCSEVSWSSFFLHSTLSCVSFCRICNIVLASTYLYTVSVYIKIIFSWRLVRFSMIL